MPLTFLLGSLVQAIRHTFNVGRQISQSSPKRRQQAWRFALQVEPLETRELLATAIGINIERVTDYMGAWMFTDAFKQSRPWIRTTNGTPDFNIALDANGYPVQLTTGQRVDTLMFNAIGNHYPSGPYTAWWQGDGIVTWGGDVNAASIQLSTTTGPDGQQYHVARFTVTPGLSTFGIYLTVTPSTPIDNAPIHDVHVWMPAYNGQSFVGQIWHPGAAFSPFHPLFLQRLAPFHNLRFMDIGSTSESTVQHWSDRRPWNYATQVTGDPNDGYTVQRGFQQNGIAPEYIVELANELNADAWINMPHLADYVPPSSPADSYLLQLANLVHNTLHPNLHVYLEYSNEVWNSAPGFDAYPWVISQLGGNPTLDQFVQFVAQQETRVFGIWSQVFSDRPGQLVRVLAGQEGNDYYDGPLLAAMNQQGGTYDAFAVGAYLNAEPFHANTTVDQVLADTVASIPTIIGGLQRTRALINQSSAQLGRHLAFVSYEGGPGLESQFFPPQDPTLAQDTRMLNQAMIDPRMYGIYINFLNQLRTTGLELLDHFEYSGRVDLDASGGLYGALNYQDQPTADAPKYHALLAYMSPTHLAFAVAGAPGRVLLYRSDNTLLADFAPYGSSYTGPISVALGDINGDGYADLVTGALVGNPDVRVYDGRALATGTFNPANPNASLLAQWFPYALQFNVGANVAVGDIESNGYADIVTGATVGNPDVRIYRGRDIATGTFNPTGASLLAQWFPYALQFNVGANVAVGDVNGDGYADIVTGATAGNPDVRIYNGRDLAQGNFNPTSSLLAQWFAYGMNFNVGAFVAVGDINGDGFGDIITGASAGNPDVHVYSGRAIASRSFDSGHPEMSLLEQFFAYDLNFNVGVTVAAADFESTGRFDILTGASGGSPHYRVVRANATGIRPSALFENIPTDLQGGIAVGA
jgi:hypothetical protein